MIINLPTKLIDITVANISQSFTHKMGRKPAGIDMKLNYVTVSDKALVMQKLYCILGHIAASAKRSLYIG